MNKPLFFGSKLWAPALLLLCGIFIQSCTEEMPILKPLNNTVSTKSSIVLNINSKKYTLVNQTPGYVIFSNITVGSGTALYTQYNFSGSNGSQSNPIDYVLNFGPDSTNSGKYIFGTSQLNFNSKTYTTINRSGTAQLKVDQLDDSAKTASGSFGYYLYNSVYSPTDSIYISGSFNILK